MARISARVRRLASSILTLRRSAHLLRLPTGFDSGIGSEAVVVMLPIPLPVSSAVVGLIPLDPDGPLWNGVEVAELKPAESVPTAGDEVVAMRDDG